MENNVAWHPRATRQFLKIDRRYRAAIEAKVAMLKDFRIFFEVIDGEPKIINIMQVKRRTTTTYKH